VNGLAPTGSVSSGFAAASGVVPGTTATTGQSLGSNDNYMLRFRVHKDFYP